MVFAVPVLALGLGLGGVLGAVVVATLFAALGAAWSARRTPAPGRTIFTVDGLVVMTITMAFAWLSSADVFFLRMLASPQAAGSYAAVAVLVKATFILPSTLSLYLLPRFVRNRDDADLTRTGMLASAGISALAGVLVVGGSALLGSWIIALIYGDRYALASEFLLPVAIAYLPWVILQGLLIQVTSIASKAAAIVLSIAVIVQAVVFTTTLPDVGQMLWGLGIIGWMLVAIIVGAKWIGNVRSRREAHS